MISNFHNYQHTFTHIYTQYAQIKTTYLHALTPTSIYHLNQRLYTPKFTPTSTPARTSIYTQCRAGIRIQNVIRNCTHKLIANHFLN